MYTYCEMVCYVNCSYLSQDTAGSERYESMSRIYYRGAKAAIVCFGKPHPLTDCVVCIVNKLPPQILQTSPALRGPSSGSMN